MSGARTDRFNEAAGNTPRKTRRWSGRFSRCRPSRASMRPRGIPRGKRSGCPRSQHGPPGASMRPRGIPRGKPPRPRADESPGIRRHHASMRPRGIPRGKRQATLPAGHPDPDASMRPRGIPRGKPRARTGLRKADANRKTVYEGAASMRPRGIPRGKTSAFGSQRRPGPSSRFNEAAGNTPRKTASADHSGPDRSLAALQ